MTRRIHIFTNNGDLVAILPADAIEAAGFEAIAAGHNAIVAYDDGDVITETTAAALALALNDVQNFVHVKTADGKYNVDNLPELLRMADKIKSATLVAYDDEVDLSVEQVEDLRRLAKIVF